MGENNRVHGQDTPTEEFIPMEEKNTTVADEKVNCLVSAVSDSVETVSQELGRSLPLVQGNEKSNRFQKQ